MTPFDDLDRIRALYSAIDPVPPELVRHAQFALDIELLGIDVARPDLEHTLSGAGARGEPQDKLLTFAGTTVTITIQIRVRDDGDVRVDGWLTPPAEHRVELRTERGTTVTQSAPHGRFAFDRIPRGAAQFVVRPPAGTDTIVTPTITL